MLCQSWCKVYRVGTGVCSRLGMPWSPKLSDCDDTRAESALWPSCLKEKAKNKTKITLKKPIMRLCIWFKFRILGENASKPLISSPVNPRSPASAQTSSTLPRGHRLSIGNPLDLKSEDLNKDLNWALKLRPQKTDTSNSVRFAIAASIAIDTAMRYSV